MISDAVSDANTSPQNRPGVRCTKASFVNIPVEEFLFFAKYLLSSLDTFSYLTGFNAAELRRHLSNMGVVYNRWPVLWQWWKIKRITKWKTPSQIYSRHRPLARYVKLRAAHAPGMPGTFSTSPWVSDPDMHHGTCVMHGPRCMPGTLASGFLWSRWWRKVPGIPGACATHHFTYLTRDPCIVE